MISIIELFCWSIICLSSIYNEISIAIIAIVRASKPVTSGGCTSVRNDRAVVRYCNREIQLTKKDGTNSAQWGILHVKSNQVVNF